MHKHEQAWAFIFAVWRHLKCLVSQCYMRVAHEHLQFKIIYKVLFKQYPSTTLIFRNKTGDLLGVDGGSCLSGACVNAMCQHVLYMFQKIFQKRWVWNDIPTDICVHCHHHSLFPVFSTSNKSDWQRHVVNQSFSRMSSRCPNLEICYACMEWDHVELMVVESSSRQAAWNMGEFFHKKIEKRSLSVLTLFSVSAVFTLFPVLFGPAKHKQWPLPHPGWEMKLAHSAWIKALIYSGSHLDGIPRRQHCTHLKKHSLQFRRVFEWDGFYCMIPYMAR